MRLLQGCFIYYSDQGTEMPPPAKFTFYRTRGKNTQPARFLFHTTLAAVLSFFFSAVEWGRVCELFRGTRPSSGRTYFSLPFDPFDWRNAQPAGWMGEWDKQRKATLCHNPNTYKVTVSLVHLGSNGVWKRLQSVCCRRLGGGEAMPNSMKGEGALL